MTWTKLSDMPEPTFFNGPDTRPLESAGPDDVDREREERDWYDLEMAAREFLKAHGMAAMLRCVSRALEETR
jgi:hypothetical protein